MAVEVRLTPASGKSCVTPALGVVLEFGLRHLSFQRRIASGRKIMSRYHRREFLADVGRGMLVASVGSALAQDLGLAPAALAAGSARTLDVRGDGAAGGLDAGDARRPALAGRRRADEGRDRPPPTGGRRRAGQRPHVRRPGLRRLPRDHGAGSGLPHVARAARGAARRCPS